MAPLESTTPAIPAAAAQPIDTELFGLLNEAIVRLYKEENARIDPRNLGRLVAEKYEDITTSTDDPDDRRAMIKLIITMHRKALRTFDGPAQAKERA